jgi:hypothetical protein
MPREIAHRTHFEKAGVIVHAKDQPAGWRPVSKEEVAAIRAARPIHVAPPQASGNMDLFKRIAEKLRELDGKIDAVSDRLEKVIDAAYVTEIEGVE